MLIVVLLKRGTIQMTLSKIVLYPSDKYLSKWSEHDYSLYSNTGLRLHRRLTHWLINLNVTLQHIPGRTRLALDSPVLVTGEVFTLRPDNDTLNVNINITQPANRLGKRSDPGAKTNSSPKT